MALEDGEYRRRELKMHQLYQEKTSLRPDGFLSTKKTDSTVFSGLWVHLVLVQSDYNKTELPAETQAVEITSHAPGETHGVILKITIHSEMTKVLICLCVCLLLATPRSR